MSHRRRFLNLIMENQVNGVYSLSLRRIDLHSRQNSLFYPSAAAAEAAAAARDPEALFSVDRSNMAAAAKKLKKIRPAAATAAGTMSFQPTKYNSTLPCFHRMCCAGLSESRTVFMDPHSCGAFLYDADERCVVTLPNLRAMEWWFPVFLSAAGAGEEEDRVYIMDRTLKPDGLQLQALRRRDQRWGYSQSWHYDDLPPPPFNDVGRVDSYALVTTGASSSSSSSSDVICVSTKRVGTYCLDTASRTWSKAGDRALPFAGNVEHDADLDVWVGFLDTSLNNVNRSLNTICASSGDLFCAAEVHTRRELLWSDPCEALEPPYDHVFADRNEIDRVPRIVGLGSGKFCAVQFFKTVRGTCRCSHREGDDDFDADRFAVFTGVEVMRSGSDHEPDDNGCSTSDNREGELRIVFHKSKRYMLAPTLSYPDVRFIL